MEKLLIFFNRLSIKDRAEFCSRIDKTENSLRKSISKKQKFREKMCTRIEKATNGAVTRKDLRPDDWIEIWPELAEK